MGSAAQTGTLHHRFLEGVDVAQAHDEAKLRAQLSALVVHGVFTSEEAAAIDLGAIARFWRSQIGVQIARHAVGLRREVPFTARFTLREVAQIIGQETVDAATEEFVVVQGVADLVVLTEQEVWLLDFKTDDVPGGELDVRAQRYRPQLRLYASALARIYRKPVSRCWLHFLRAGQTVEV
jgi:ATP-dependent helicase/nuclease subunit A